MWHLKPTCLTLSDVSHTCHTAVGALNMDKLWTSQGKDVVIKAGRAGSWQPMAFLETATEAPWWEGEERWRQTGPPLTVAHRAAAHHRPQRSDPWTPWTTEKWPPHTTDHRGGPHTPWTTERWPLHITDHREVTAKTTDHRGGPRTPRTTERWPPHTTDHRELTPAYPGPQRGGCNAKVARITKEI